MDPAKKNRFQYRTARVLDDARIKGQHTHEDCARAVDVGRDFIGRVLRGDSGLSFFTAAELARFLGVSLDMVVEGHLAAQPEPVVSQEEKAHRRLSKRLQRMDPCLYPMIERFLTYLERKEWAAFDASQGQDAA